MHGEGSGRFPISLDLQMLECELFRTSETTLIILEGFRISLSAWILLVLQMKNLLVSPRTIQPAYPNSCLGVTLRWDSFIHTSDDTAGVHTQFLLYKWNQQHIWDWWWHQVMLSRFDASSNFLDCAQKTTWVKAGDTFKSEALYTVFILLMHFLLFHPQLFCLLHPDHWRLLLLFFTGFLSSVSSCLSQTGHKPNKV